MASSHFRKTAKNHASVLERKGNYQATCKAKATNAGFNSSQERRSEVHHVVCEHSIELRFQYYPDDKEAVKYIENCLWITPWDINNADNLIGLPRNRRFRVDWAGTSDETQWTPVEHPSHQVDHNTATGYTKEVSKYLRKNIWTKLQAKKNEPHEVGVELIKEQLQAASTWYLGQLDIRGKRPPGKVEGWRNRYEDSFRATWFIPFSMGLVPTPRNPGAKGSVATAALTQIKKKLA